MAELKKFNDVQELTKHGKKLKIKKTLEGIFKAHNL